MLADSLGESVKISLSAFEAIPSSVLFSEVSRPRSGRGDASAPDCAWVEGKRLDTLIDILEMRELGEAVDPVLAACAVASQQCLSARG